MNQKIFNPAIVKCMEKNPSIANPRYNEHIFPVPCTSLYRRSTVAGMTDKWGFKRSRILKDGYSPRGGGVLPYMAYTGMCRWTGYGFWPLCPKQGM